MKRRAVGAILCVFAVASFGFGDSLELKNGSLIKGQYMGGTQTEISFRVGSSIQHYPVTDVLSLKFETVTSSGSGLSNSAPETTSATQPALAARPVESARPATESDARAKSAGITVPAGTKLLVRTIDAIDSDKNQIGDKFQASLEEPLVVADSVLAPKGTTVYGRLEQVKAAGQLSGKSELRLSLTGIVVKGQTVALTTGEYSLSGDSRSASTAKRVGGGAALGAVIGALAGGGKGAAIGAGIGAGAGTAVQVMTKGEQVHVPSETLLEFTLDQPVTFLQ